MREKQFLLTETLPLYLITGNTKLMEKDIKYELVDNSIQKNKIIVQ